VGLFEARQLGAIEERATAMRRHQCFTASPRKRGWAPPTVLALLLGAAPVARAEVAPAPTPTQEASPHATSFAKKCGSCHTLGEGDRTGPDLLGVTTRRDRKWLSAFIRTPGAVIDSGDATASELLAKFKGVRMGDQTLSDEELGGLLGYIEECTTRGGCKLATGPVKPARDATPAEVAKGRALFEGATPLAGGGPPCLSCHSVRGVGPLGGGTLAKDLTHAFARLGEQGTSSALASTPFPLMKDIYAAQPLRDAEAFQIKAFLYQSSLDGAQPVKDQNFIYLGVLGALIGFGAIGGAWTGRLRGVRQTIVRRGTR